MEIYKKDLLEIRKLQMNDFKFPYLNSSTGMSNFENYVNLSSGMDVTSVTMVGDKSCDNNHTFVTIFDERRSIYVLNILQNILNISPDYFLQKLMEISVNEEIVNLFEKYVIPFTYFYNQNNSQPNLQNNNLQKVYNQLVKNGKNYFSYLIFICVKLLTCGSLQNCDKNCDNQSTSSINQDEMPFVNLILQKNLQNEKEIIQKQEQLQLEENIRIKATTILRNLIIYSKNINYINSIFEIILIFI